jgi:hypothetical protein
MATESLTIDVCTIKDPGDQGWLQRRLRTLHCGTHGADSPALMLKSIHPNTSLPRKLAYVASIIVGCFLK